MVSKRVSSVSETFSCSLSRFCNEDYNVGIDEKDVHRTSCQSNPHVDDYLPRECARASLS